MIVADVLAPIWRQDISNHHGDSVATIYIYRVTFQQAVFNRDKTVGNPLISLSLADSSLQGDNTLD